MQHLSIPPILQYKPLVLVGIMGAGKSSIGKRLSKELNVSFYDSDSEIEKKAGCSVKDIVYYAGTEYFHSMEMKTLDMLLGYFPSIIATGGDAFTYDESYALLKKRALSVCIDVPLDILQERINRRNTRPFLDGPDRNDVLEQLWNERMPLYRRADIVIESKEDPHHVIVERIIRKIDAIDVG